MRTFKITSKDRLLILAPHPDDESLATGGLIQRAVKAGAKVRVLFATDGDNNPWPQRFLERKLQITFTDRARWGRRRRKEALAALDLLGLPKGSARFLGLPDQGITNLLMRAEEGVLFTLWAEIEEWEPTTFRRCPSATDAHPDHSALFVLVHLAMMRLECSAANVPLHYSRPAAAIRARESHLAAHAARDRPQACRHSRPPEPDGPEPQTLCRLRDRTRKSSTALRSRSKRTTITRLSGVAFDRGALRIQLRLRGSHPDLAQGQPAPRHRERH